MDFVLVHGAYHGPWCWERLVPELERLGHRVVAPDLPISEPGLGAADYAQAVIQAIGASSEPILVGHSMAGLVVPLVAAARPVRRLVLLAAFMAQPGRTANEQREAEPIDGRIPPETAEWVDLGQDLWSVGASTATELFFHDLEPAVATWAAARLRPQCYAIYAEPSPLEAWPDVPVDAIVCGDDRAINPDWVRAATADRLGITAREIGGGHSPFLGRPAELAALLDAIAAQTA